MTSWRNLAVAAVAVAATIACSKRNVFPNGHSIIIDPTVTRATELSFETGDRIGLTVTKSGEQSHYISNAMLTCDGTLFAASGVEWYADLSHSAQLRAYYPYDAEGEPTTFSVRSDQRGDGYTLSDFMAASRSSVTPTSTAVPMVFRHLMARINILITNNTAATVTETGIVACALTAAVDVAAGTATAAEAPQSAGIAAHETEAQKIYNLIIPPQSAALMFYVKLDDGSQMRSVTMSTADYASGRQFTARLTVNDNRLEVSLSGQIEGWGDNTDLTPDESGGSQSGPAGSGTVSWGEVDYPTVTLADGRTWMAQNLRYVPAGKTEASSDPGDGSGFWNPCNSETEATKDAGFIAQHGYLYGADVAHGGRASEGEQAVRGICPEGWHLPTTAEFEALKIAYPSPAALVEVFNCVPGGCISKSIPAHYQYSEYGDVFLWGSSVNNVGTYCFKLSYEMPGLYEYFSTRVVVGASVRCIKDND